MSQDIGNLDAHECRSPWSSPRRVEGLTQADAAPTGALGLSCSPATALRATQPSSRGPARPHTSPAATPSTVAPGPAARGAASPRRSRCRRRHPRLAPGPPPPAHPLARHRPPDPDPAGTGSRPGQAPEVVLRPLRRRATQRDVAVRLHPLPTHPSRRHTGRDTDIITWLDDHARYALHVSAAPASPGRSCSPPSAALCAARIPRLHADRQRHGLHDPVRRRPRRPQRPRARAPPTRHRAEELPAQPPHHLRQGRAVPADDEEVAPRPDPQPATLAELQTLLEAFAEEYNHHRPHRSLPHRATPATVYTSPTESHPGSDRARHPRPDPPRPRRPIRLRDPAPQRPTAPHRHRPNPRRNPRPPARPGPAHPRRQRRHRRTAPRTHPRPRPRLPTHRSTQRTHASPK